MAQSTASTVRIEGLSKLHRELRQFDTALPKELKEVSKAAAELVADTSRSNVPVRKGDLQRAIKAAATAKGAEVRVKLIYAAPIHFGWRAHNIEPQPFVYDAVDERADEVYASFEQGLAELLERTFTPGTGE